MATLLLYLTTFVALATEIAASSPQPYREILDDVVISASTFQTPPVRVKPKFRYWLPDASVDPALLAADIKDIGNVGAGGIELNNYFLYGGLFGTPEANWDIYGFGTPVYNQILRAAAQATQENGLIMDLAMGPQSGQGVPAISDNPGLAYDLNTFNVTVPPGSTFHGQIPGHGSGTLVSVTTAIIINKTLDSMPSSSLLGGPPFNFTVYTIAADSLSDITDSVNSDGIISVEFPTDSNALGYIVYAAYYSRSLARACVSGRNPQNFIQNGSFTVDHFSARGAKVTTDFLEQYVLVNGVKELFQQIGNYIWEDSVEIPSPLYWTPDLSATFKEMHGYDIGKYVILLSQNNGALSNMSYPTWVYSDASDQGQGYVSDFRATLSYLLTTYYGHLANWTHDYLGIQFSAQVGYNLPVDMLQVVPVIDAPEDESLAFNNTIDSYRQYTGPANLAGKRVISNEMGAQVFHVYQQTLPELLGMTKRAYSAGNNQMVFHGSPYTWQYPDTTWPGYTSFAYLFAEQHNRHQPGWENGYSDILAFVSRNNLILQSGIPKRDVVFWDKSTAQPGTVSSLYNSSDLVEAGFGYDYISPANFDLPNAVISNQTLALNGPAYKVLILRQNDLLTVDGAAKLVSFAQQGLQIVISGGIPTKVAASSGGNQARQSIESIVSLPNVHQVPAGPLAPVLASIGVQPLTKVSANQTWYTYWREDTQNQASYIYVYNDGSYSTGTISFKSTKTPFFFDAWTGEQSPVLQYTVSDSYTTIPLELASAQSLLIAFLSCNLPSTPRIHVTSAPPSILGFTYAKSTGLVALISSSTPPSTIITTSDNKSHPIPSSLSISTPFALGPWTLIAERWGPPNNLSNIDPSVFKSNTTHTLPTLLSWPLILGLANTSGVGYYSTSFPWTHNATSTGAIISFGRVVHTLRVKINGHALPPLDVADARADISAYLVQGQNSVEAVAATTLFNGLVPVWEQLMTSGMSPLLPVGYMTGNQVEAGLVGSVVVTPYWRFRVGK